MSIFITATYQWRYSLADAGRIIQLAIWLGQASKAFTANLSSKNLLNLSSGWCERGDSNPHGCPLDPKSSASASSATLAESGQTPLSAFFRRKGRVKITRRYV